MKISIRFFNDKEVRAAWNEENNKWYFSVLDIIGAIRKEDNYEKRRNYWKYLKAKLKKENSKLVSATTQLKLTTAGKVIYRCKLHIFRMSSVFCGAHSFILKKPSKSLR